MANQQLDVLVICGSLRKGSYNAALARTLLTLAPPAIKLRPAPPFETFPIYNFDIQNSTGFPADVNAWADAIRGADGLIIVSPAQGQAGGAAVGRRRHPRRLAHAISSAAVADLGRRHPVRPARGHRHLRRAEIRREDARAQG